MQIKSKTKSAGLASLSMMIYCRDISVLIVLNITNCYKSSFEEE